MVTGVNVHRDAATQRLQAAIFIEPWALLAGIKDKGHYVGRFGYLKILGCSMRWHCVDCGFTQTDHQSGQVKLRSRSHKIQCRRCYDRFLSKDRRNTSGIPTAWTIESVSKEQLIAIDREVASTHNSKQEVLTVRNKETCKLFRCLICWHYIFADDSIVPFGDGYAHKLCKQ